MQEFYEATQNKQEEDIGLEPIDSKENSLRDDKEVGTSSITEASTSSNVDNAVLSSNPEDNSRIVIPSSPNTTDEEDHDSHEYQNTPNPITNLDTLTHLLKGSLGIGILAMPNVFDNSSLMVGSIAAIVIAMLCIHCLHIRIRSEYKLYKRLKVPDTHGYPDSMKQALKHGPKCFQWLAKCVPWFIDIIMVIYQLGICCVYIIFITTNIEQVLDYYWKPLPINTHMLLLFVPLILINCIRNDKLLAMFITLQNLFAIVSLSLLLSFMFHDKSSMPEMFGSFRNFALYFGMTLFLLEAIGVIIALANNIKTKSFGRYRGELNIGISVIIILYLIIGFYGYWKYRLSGYLKDGVHGYSKDGVNGYSKDGVNGYSKDGVNGYSKYARNVTLNISQENDLPQSIKNMFLVAIIITYTLQIYMLVEILWNTYFAQLVYRYVQRETWKHFCKYFCRIFVPALTFALAIKPKLGEFMAFFGALHLSALSIVFPAIIEICILWPKKDFGRLKITLIKNIFLIVFGLVGLFSGTSASIIWLIKSNK